MQDPMNEVIPYLKSRLAEYSATPELCGASIAEYKRLLDTAENNPAEYLTAAGDMFSVAKAEQHDRISSMISLYEKLGIEGCVHANAIILAAVNNSSGYSDLNYNIGKARDEAAILINRESERRDRLMELIGAVIGYRTCLPEEKSEKKQIISSLWNKLDSIDAGISWKKISSDPLYRRTLYYDDERLALIGRWIEEALA